MNLLKVQNYCIFENGCSLEFIEVVEIEQAEKIKYRYHFMDETRNLIFRYDNAPHHVEIASFPHHKHTVEKVIASREPVLSDILEEISRKIRS